MEEIAKDIISVTTVGADLESQKIVLSTHCVWKVFKPGDNVKVVTGRNAGKTRLIVGVSKNVVTF